MGDLEGTGLRIDGTVGLVELILLMELVHEGVSVIPLSSKHALSK